jgi:hypothetical protein
MYNGKEILGREDILFLGAFCIFKEGKDTMLSIIREQASDVGEQLSLIAEQLIMITEIMSRTSGRNHLTAERLKRLGQTECAEQLSMVAQRMERTVERVNGLALRVEKTAQRVSLFASRTHSGIERVITLQ